jgi:hypothetical protein
MALAAVDANNLKLYHINVAFDELDEQKHIKQVNEIFRDLNKHKRLRPWLKLSTTEEGFPEGMVHILVQCPRGDSRHSRPSRRRPLPRKAIPDWVAHPVQSGTAEQRAWGEFLAFFWGRNEAPTVRRSHRRQDRRHDAASSCGCTVVTRRRRLSRRCVLYRVGTRPASSVWYALTADLAGLRKFSE